MNSSVYIFGNLGNGYTQYPNDYTKSIFDCIYKSSQATTQIAIHRNNNLMYYCYLRKLVDNKYVGLCVVINGKAITKLFNLFNIFENIIELMVREGYLIHLNENGEITAKLNVLYDNKEEIDLITSCLKNSFERLEDLSQKIPPLSYSSSNNSIKTFTIQDVEDKVVQSSYLPGYTFIYKSKDFNTNQLNSYCAVIKKKEKELDALKLECSKYKKEILSLKSKQRNILWVSVLFVVVLVLGFVVWNKVLFPSEVTKKNMGEYIYYGPMMNGEPYGVGVAIYHQNDKDGRLYYYGNFKNGKRIDDDAIMFYKDGSYFKGSMNEDKWVNGLFFNVDKEHFIGEFKDNEPWNGEWYKHVKEQTIQNGE